MRYFEYIRQAKGAIIALINEEYDLIPKIKFRVKKCKEVYSKYNNSIYSVTRRKEDSKWTYRMQKQTGKKSWYSESEDLFCTYMNMINILMKYSNISNKVNDN